MKIYVASSWRNDYQQQVVEVLRSMGHEVYDFKNPPNGKGGFAWSDIDEDWEDWTTDQYKKALLHPVADEGFHSDFEGMKWADTCVMVLPCGRSANTEAGWMKGAGKEVYVFSPIKQEPELMYKIYDGILSSVDELHYQFGKVKDPSINNPMSPITHLTQNAIAVDLPIGSTIQGIDGNDLLFTNKAKDDPYPLGPDDVDGITLPTGPWSTLGMSDKLWREDKIKVIEKTGEIAPEFIGDSSQSFYKNYLKPNTGISNIDISFASLLKSKGITKPQLILIKK